MSSWHSYPSIYNLGHKAIADLLTGPVNVEEKVDGSQFSFGLFLVPDETGCEAPGTELKVRSKGAVMHVDAPEKMFTEGVEYVKSIQHLLHPGWTYRGEYLKKPKHNALTYDRVPKNHVIIFDVNTGEEEYLDYDAKLHEAARLGLECVPRLFSGKIDTVDQFRSFLGTVSVLGGQNIEGVVIKPTDYQLFGRDKKCLLGKFVSEAFKEVHSLSWKADNPSGGDILALLGAKYGTAARWNKAILHMRERGLLLDDVKDIGPLIREIPEDVRKECEDEIKQELFSWAWPHIRRQCSRGFPEFYKEQLLKLQFERTNEPSEQKADGDIHAESDTVSVLTSVSGVGKEGE